jgi:uncharacterized protein YkwD
MMPRKWSILLLMTLYLLIVSGGIWAQEDDDILNISPVIASVNAYREENNLPTFVPSTLLMEIATHISELVGTQENPDGERIIIEFGYQAIAYEMGWWGDSDDLDAVADYIINNFGDSDNREIGVAGVYSDYYDTYIYTLIIATSNSCMPETQEDDLTVQTEEAEAVLAYVNEARIAEGLEPLTLGNEELFAAALWYSEDMQAYGYPTRRSGGVPHIGTDGSDVGERILREGYLMTTARENILLRFDIDAFGAFDMWWNSPPHKENILADDITEMQLAFTCNPDSGEFYYTQVFATPFVEIPLEEVQELFITLVNEARIANNLPEFVIDERLTTSAQDEVTYMVANDYEVQDDLFDNLRNTGYTAQKIAYLTFVDGDAIQAVEAWLDSRDSYDYLIDSDYQKMGVGVAVSGASYVFFVWLTN